MRLETVDAVTRSLNSTAVETGVAGLRVGVVVATLGRPAESADLLRHLRTQSLAPSAIVMSVESVKDLPASLPDGVEVVTGPRGLCAQRNRGIEKIRNRCDVIAFFDDDYLPAKTALAGIATLFARHPDVVGATGLVLADGVGRGGVSLAEAEALVASPPPPPEEGAWIERDIVTAYGCNMAFRVSAMAEIEFDERLPLYGWQEDVDFAGQISRYGRVVETRAFCGVHRGVSTGRTPGARLGFSQIVNPIYLARKGTMRWSHALRIISGNLIANHVRSLKPEPHVDRMGRMRGNWIGLLHIASGRLDPQYMLQVK